MAIIWDKKPAPNFAPIVVEEEFDEWLEEVEAEVDAAVKFLDEEKSPCPEKGKGFGKES